MPVHLRARNRLTRKLLRSTRSKLRLYKRVQLEGFDGRIIDETHFCAWQFVFQIPSPVRTEANRSSAQKLSGNFARPKASHVADE